MAIMSGTQPKSDQPRVNTESLKRDSGPATMEYRTQGLKSYNARSPKRDQNRMYRA